MPETIRIALLDTQLANQIAAGEVVERPASVVKELLENSIDAGASRVEIEIERGGTRLIRITDNGSGIYKDDMALALTRHATSKIRETADLSNIMTLGFRGEALASISSVSRLTLTSRTASADIAWQAIAHGRDMRIELQPAASPVGTRIEVADLFFNTPARQKFLRTEKTEFSHIEEVFKRQALANFDVALILKHNHKIIKRVAACKEEAQKLKRIAQICGQPFAENVIPFECEHELVQISGWLGKPNYHRSESDIQYVFINNRPVKDKLLNHAIRTAYEGRLPAGRWAAFVIYLTIDPHQVDVNVHPTKHEVRFSEQRLVHDLLAKSVSDALSETEQSMSQSLFETSMSIESTKSDQLNQHNIEQNNQSSENRSDKHAENHSDMSTPSIAENAFAKETYQYIKSAVLPEKKFVSSHDNNRPSNHFHLNNDRVAHSVSRAVKVEPNHSESNTANGNSDNQNSAGYIEHLLGDFWLYRQNDAAENNCRRTDTQAIGNQVKCGHVYLVDGKKLLPDFFEACIQNQNTVKNKPLLFPKTLDVSDDLIEDFYYQQIINSWGFACHVKNENQLSITHFPLWSEALDSENLILILGQSLSELHQRISHFDSKIKSSYSIKSNLEQKELDQTAGSKNSLIKNQLAGEILTHHLSSVFSIIPAPLMAVAISAVAEKIVNQDHTKLIEEQDLIRLFSAQHA